jgi:hypothetical protein
MRGRFAVDFAKLVELFDRHHVSFVSVTQQFNTTTSMGRLTLNVLLSFARARAGCFLWMRLFNPTLRGSAYSIGRTRVTRPPRGSGR